MQHTQRSGALVDDNRLQLSWLAERLVAGDCEMPVEGQYLTDALAPHDLEAHGVGEGDRSVIEAPEPTRQGGSDDVVVHGCHDVYAGLEHRFKKQDARTRPTPSQNECVHLRRDKGCRHQ